MNQSLSIPLVPPGSNWRAGYFGRTFQNSENKTHQGPLKDAVLPETISFRLQSCRSLSSPLRINRRITANAQVPPSAQEPRGRSGSVKQRRAEDSTEPPGHSDFGEELFFKDFCGGRGSIRGKSRAPPGGVANSKTETSGLLGSALSRRHSGLRSKA